MATTLSLLVIFLPVVFMGGRIGQFFSSFGGTVAFSIFMSLFVSFTLTPMLCSRFLKFKQQARRRKQVELGVAGDRWRLRLDSRLVAAAPLGDRRCLSWACWPVTPALFRTVGFDFIPRDDQRELEVAITMPEGLHARPRRQLFRRDRRPAAKAPRA